MRISLGSDLWTTSAPTQPDAEAIRDALRTRTPFSWMVYELHYASADRQAPRFVTVPLNLADADSVPAFDHNALTPEWREADETVADARTVTMVLPRAGERRVLGELSGARRTAADAEIAKLRMYLDELENGARTVDSAAYYAARAAERLAATAAEAAA